MLKVLGNLTTKRNITINDTVQISSINVEEKQKTHLEGDYTDLDMEIQLVHIKDCVSTKIDQETQSNCEYTLEGYASGLFAFNEYAFV